MSEAKNHDIASIVRQTLPLFRPFKKLFSGCVRCSDVAMAGLARQSLPERSVHWDAFFVKGMGHWIGLREILQETMVFTIKYRGFL